MTTVTGSVVLYNNKLSEIDKIVNNFFNAIPKIYSAKLILINNSPDNLLINKYIKKIETESKEIIAVVPKSNKGFGAGHNLALRYIDSDYHLVINPDVVIKDEQDMRKMIDFMEDNLQYGLLSPLIKYPNGEIQHLLKKKSNVTDMFLRFVGGPFFKKRKESFVCLPSGYLSTHDADNVPGSFMLFRSDIFREIKGFDEHYFLYMEDSDITMKINEVSRTVFFPHATIYHEWQRENRKNISGMLQMLRSMFIYFNKWGWKLW